MILRSAPPPKIQTHIDTISQIPNASSDASKKAIKKDQFKTNLSAPNANECISLSSKATTRKQTLKTIMMIAPPSQNPNRPKSI
jgi:hypothetical protein